MYSRMSVITIILIKLSQVECFMCYSFSCCFPIQVWRAELVLTDFVLHVMSTSSDFDKVVALELGAGTGKFHHL